ncbi:hypothetical protein PI125_g10238 [Phytophthora idaei]|nr:hypothetical protein PI125_g10238 [Phytophthora idaei]KAG3154841.1 hypothetical protein PI126_g9446 [Phytophthora idaei]
MILTAESRKKDWENSAFGTSQGKTNPMGATGSQNGRNMQKSSEESKKKTPSTELTRHHCGVKEHYKKNCPDLLGEEKPSGRKNAQEKCARSAEKSTEAVGLMATLDDGDRVHKREVVVCEAVKLTAKN